MMEKYDDKTEAVLKVVKDYLKKLLHSGKTGRYSLTIEANLSQGGVGDVYIQTTAKEKV
jgi:hypothetical protein